MSDNDLESLKHKLEQAEASRLAQSRFLSNISHELKTPIQGVLRLLELLSASELNADQRDILLTCQNSSSRLLDLVRDILDFHKLELQQLEPDHVEFDFRDMLESTVRLFSEQASTKEIELINFVDPNLPERVVGDPIRLKQVLNNFIRNAVKFTEKGQVLVQVTLETWQHNKATALFKISDSGTGISPEIKDKLFTAMLPGGSQTGTGLGMALCKELVELMGGEIDVTSKPGEGTCFSFSLTFDTPETTEAFPKHEMNIKNGLVLASNPHLQFVVEKYLNHFGVNCTHCENSENIKELLNTEPKPDFVLINGYDLEPGLLFWLSKNSKQNILMTPFGSDLDTPYFKNLHKPIALKDLVLLAKQAQTPYNRILEKLKQLTIVKPMMNVLLIDNSEINIKLCRRLFAVNDADLQVAPTYNQASKMLKDDQYHLIIANTQINGVDKLNDIKELTAEFLETPFIGLSISHSQQEQKQASDAGLISLQENPVRFEPLLKTINSYFSE